MPDTDQPAAEPTYARTVRNDGRRLRIVKRGGGHRDVRDAYHILLSLPWWVFALLTVLFYFAVNGLFGWLYSLDPNSLLGARPGSYVDGFNFSVETLGTIGYGAISPRDGYANTLVAIEAFLNIAITALATGLIFARVSRPTARIRFATSALIGTYGGQRMLMFRMANERTNHVLEAEVSVVLARYITNEDGSKINRLHEIRMVRNRSPLLALTCTALHLIDDTSPLHNETADSLAAARAEIIVVFSGVDEAFTQRIYARHSYIASELVFNRRYVDVVQPLPEGGWLIDYTDFDTLMPQG